MKAFEELKETTKKDIIIDGIMRSKGVYLLASKPKVGKSLFALQLANSIDNKKAFLGHEILNPSPVLYITTELSDSQLKNRCNLLGISFEKNKFFIIDRDEKQNINFMDIEYQVKEFAEELNGRILILDMLKNIDFNISYDINSYQDISQKLMPKIRSYADKYNLTILFVHHLNKLGKTLGSTGFDAVVDGIIRLSKNSFDDNTIKMEIINRDFPDEEEYLHKDKDQVIAKQETIINDQKNIIENLNKEIKQLKEKIERITNIVWTKLNDASLAVAHLLGFKNINKDNVNHDIMEYRVQEVNRKHEPKHEKSTKNRSDNYEL